MSVRNYLADVESAREAGVVLSAVKTLSEEELQILARALAYQGEAELLRMFHALRGGGRVEEGSWLSGLMDALASNTVVDYLGATAAGAATSAGAEALLVRMRVPPPLAKVLAVAVATAVAAGTAEALSEDAPEGGSPAQPLPPLSGTTDPFRQR